MLRTEYLGISKTQVRAWHAWLVFGLMMGVTTRVVVAANQSGEFEVGRMGSSSWQCSSGVLCSFIAPPVTTSRGQLGEYDIAVGPDGLTYITQLVGRNWLVPWFGQVTEQPVMDNGKAGDPGIIFSNHLDMFVRGYTVDSPPYREIFVEVSPTGEDWLRLADPVSTVLTLSGHIGRPYCTSFFCADIGTQLEGDRSGVDGNASLLEVSAHLYFPSEKKDCQITGRVPRLILGMPASVPSSEAGIWDFSIVGYDTRKDAIAFLKVSLNKDDPCKGDMQWSSTIVAKDIPTTRLLLSLPKRLLHANLPSLSVSPDGKMVITYHRLRRDALRSSKYIKACFVTSSDAGASWNPEHCVGSAGSDTWGIWSSYDEVGGGFYVAYFQRIPSSETYNVILQAVDPTTDQVLYQSVLATQVPLSPEGSTCWMDYHRSLAVRDHKASIIFLVGCDLYLAQTEIR